MSDPALDNIFVFNVYCVCNCTTQKKTSVALRLLNP